MARCSRCAEAVGQIAGLADLCGEGQFAVASCEVCGPVLVDREGRRVASAVVRATEKGLREAVRAKVRGADSRLEEVRS